MAVTTSAGVFGGGCGVGAGRGPGLVGSIAADECACVIRRVLDCAEGYVLRHGEDAAVRGAAAILIVELGSFIERAGAWVLGDDAPGERGSRRRGGRVDTARRRRSFDGAQLLVLLRLVVGNLRERGHELPPFRDVLRWVVYGFGRIALHHGICDGCSCGSANERAHNGFGRFASIIDLLDWGWSIGELGGLRLLRDDRRCGAFNGRGRF